MVPYMPPLTFLGVLVFCDWAMAGIGYVVSVACGPRKAPFLSVIVVMLCSVLAGVNPTLKELGE
jgi:hypothetical protein